MREKLDSPPIHNGMSPSGKAPGSGPGIRGFESLHPSQDREKIHSVAHAGGDSEFFAILAQFYNEVRTCFQRKV